MFLTARLSTQIVCFSRIRRVESLCEKSRRRSAIRAWTRATLRRALSLFLEPFFFLACRLPRDAQRDVFSAEVSSQARSVLSLFSGKRSEISQPYGNGRAAKNTLKP